MKSYLPVGIALVIFSVLTVLFNLILVITILCTRQLRLSSKYIIILVLCTCNLITGLFEHTVSADQIFTKKNTEVISYNKKCSLLEAHQIYTPYILGSLQLSLMIALLIDFALSLMMRDVKLLFKISLSMIACAIVSSIALVLIIVPPDHVGCAISFVDYRGLNVSTYFPQAIVLVFLGCTIGYVYVKHRSQLPNFDPAKPPASPVDLFIAANIMVWFPFPLMTYLVTPVSRRCGLDELECGIDMEALLYCMRFFLYCQHFVLPLVWFANSHLRSYVRGCRCLRPNGRNTDLPLNHTTSISLHRL